MVLMFLLFVTVDFLEYWKFGDEIIGTITLKLPEDEM